MLKKILFKYWELLIGVSIFLAVIGESYGFFYDPTQTCSNVGGGTLKCVERLAQFPDYYHIPPGKYYSGGTFILSKASCVSPKSTFYFHAAHDPYTKIISDDGNNLQRQVFSGLPNLLNYLETNGAFTRVSPHVILKGNQIAAIEPRIKVCLK